MSPSITIAQAEEPLPTCTPYLMPFHIDYSGPAPISTYFRVKPAPPPGYLGKMERQGSAAQGTNTNSQDASESQTSSTSQATLVASSSSGTLETQLGESQDTLIVEDAVPTKTQGAGSRFVAAFRGRTVQGLKVELPEGYAGLILQTPEDASAARSSKRSGASAKEQVGTQATRSSRRSSQKEAMVIDTDVGGGVDGTEEAEPEGALRTLQPISTFSSFVLWNQDIPVDEGKDEYLRSIREWTRLAAEVHRVEEI
ncbi:ribonuclease H2, subunit C [Rhodofomes roseus]|uniref:Ribonuclease H2, subunit C n=1 Tax=Rhodofomes roseus TaxID=34475 RepID=A0ABQ8K7M3_9APHY|nr:ribonuclease H2, subunit C [Rhodofomes roseus]KAH9832649.1 ribonuclease H2, subunit C [Rhodofomes roseus]